MALTAGRKIQERTGAQFAYPPAAGATFYQGGLAMLSAGALVMAAQQASAAAAAACFVVGIVEKLPPYDPNSTLPTGQPIPVRRGCFLFQNSAGADAITLSNVGQPAYVVDDETVALTSATNVRPAAGIIDDVESVGVWVRVGVAL